MVGFSSALGAVSAVPGVGVSAAVGDPVAVTVPVRAPFDQYFGFAGIATGTKDCSGVVRSPNDAGQSFVIAVQPECLDGYFVSGNGYGTFDEAEIILDSRFDPQLGTVLWTTNVDGDARRVAINPDLVAPTNSRVVAGTDGASVQLFDGASYACDEVLLEVASSAGTFSGAPVRCDFVYAAFGDSFASGEGTDRFSTIEASLYENGINPNIGTINDNTLTAAFPDPNDDGNACHRSLINYAKLNVNQLAPPSMPAVLVDRTCSGSMAVPPRPIVGPPPIVDLTWFGDDPDAEVSTWSQVNQALEVLRLQGRSPAEVDFVTISMGGNDAGFADLITSCITAGVLRTAWENVVITSLGSPLSAGTVAYIRNKLNITCEEIDEAKGNDSSRVKISALPLKLELALDELAVTFPNATIFQVNYPAFLPSPDGYENDSCSGINRADASYALETADLINGIIADQVQAAAARHPNEFRVVDIAERFGPNAICPSDPSDQLVNTIEDGAVGRISDRLRDPSQEPGSLIAPLADPDLSELVRCAVDWSPVPGNECAYELPRADSLGAWFNDPANLDTLKGQLAGYDDDVPLALRDAAAFENLRGLFHPNEAGFATIACNVRAIYQGLAQNACDLTSLIDRLYVFGGTPLTGTEPRVVTLGDVLDLHFNGWDPGSLVDVWLWSDPVHLGSMTADSTGSVTGAVTIPADTAPGAHRLRLVGTTSGGQQRVIEVNTVVPGIPVPGQVYGMFIEGLAPFEIAPVVYLDTDYGDIQADSEGRAYVEVIVPAAAATAGVPLVVQGVNGTQTVLIEAFDQARPPTLADDQAEVEAGDAVEIDVLDNDTDPDDDLNEQSLSIATLPALGSAAVVVTDGEPEIVYTAGPVGGTDTFSYSVCDDGGLCSSATVTVLVVAPGQCTITGTGGPDSVIGTPGDDVICAKGGNDIIDGGGGNDLVFGGDGNDTIDGGAGNDRILGGRGDDVIRGQAGEDVLYGGRGGDSLSGNNGDDVIHGGGGADQVDGGDGNDTLFAGKGQDVVNGGAGHDTIRGRGAADTLNGNQGNDTIYGGRGPDAINGGPGDDGLFGRRGDDVIDGGTGADTVEGGRGTDRCLAAETTASCEL